MSDEKERYASELLIYSWGHNINRDVGTIRRYIFLLRNEVEKETLDKRKIKLYLEKIDNLGNELTLNQSPFDLEQVSVNSIITESIARFKINPTSEQIDFHLALDENDFVITANSVWLRRVIDILIENAIFSVQDLNNQKISIKTISDPHGISVVVGDTGIGIKKNLLPDIFLRPSIRPDGKGRGLHIAKLIIDIYYGKIELLDTSDKGTTIKVWLPFDSE